MIPAHLLLLLPLCRREPGSVTRHGLMLLERINVHQNAPQQRHRGPAPPLAAPSVGSRVTAASGEPRGAVAHGARVPEGSQPAPVPACH